MMDWRDNPHPNPEWFLNLYRCILWDLDGSTIYDEIIVADSIYAADDRARDAILARFSPGFAANRYRDTYLVCRGWKSPHPVWSTEGGAF